MHFPHPSRDLSGRALALACAFAAAVLVTPASADPLVLTGNYLQVGVSDYGTFGSNGNTEPGLLHDPTGTRNFAPGGVANDYLTPGTPHDGFAIHSTETGMITNDNDGQSDFGMASPALLTGAAAKGYQNAATWTSTAGTALTVTNRYYFNDGDEQIKVVTIITAHTDLTDVAFGRSEDPDPDVNQYGSYSTTNTRGDSVTSSRDLVSSAGADTGLTLGILNGSGDTYDHNTEISASCCSNDDPYTVLANTDTLAYPNTNEGDYGLQMAWNVGDLAAGQSARIAYSYVFGTNQGTVSDPTPTPTGLIINTTDGDLAANIFSLGSPAAQADTVAFDGGVLRLSGGSFPDNITTAPVTISANNGTVDTAGAAGGFSGSVSGVGALTVEGGGTFTLAGDNSYAGGTTLTGGTVLGVGTATALGTGALTVETGTLRALAAGLTLANDVALGKRATVDTQGYGLTLAGVITGAGGLTKVGTGTLALTVANSYAGGTVVRSGTLLVANESALGTGSLTLLAGTTLETEGSFALANAVALSGDPTFAVPSGTGVTVSGTISDTATGPAGVVEKKGAGTLVLTGTNGYSGGTVIAAGILQAGNASAIGSGRLTLDGGTLQIGAGLGLVTLANAVRVDATGGTLDTNGSGLRLTGPVSGTGGLTIMATGGTYTNAVDTFDDQSSLLLNRTNTYSGGTTVRSGTSVELFATNALGSGSLQVDADSIVALTRFSQTVTVLTGAGEIGSIGDRSAAAHGVTTATFSVQSGDFSGKIGAGTFQSGGDGGATITRHGDIHLVKLSDGTASGGTLVLSGTSTYAGGTDLEAGTLALGSNAALGAGELGMADGTTLAFTADNLVVPNAIALGGAGDADPTIDTGTMTETLSGAVTGTGALTKLGTGTLDLTGTSPYTGATTVAAGTLLVDGSVANSIVTVAGAATLGGDGTVGGIVLQSGAVLAPGRASQAETLSVAGDVTLAAGSAYRVVVTGDGASRVTTAGRAALGGAALDVVAGSGPFTPGASYTILSAAGGVSGTFGSLSADSALTSFLQPSLTYDAEDVFLTLGVRSFATSAATPNQAAAANAIQALGPTSPLYGDVLSLTPAGARQAFGATSGVSHAGSTTAQTQTTRLVSNLIFDRLWDIGGSGLGARQLLEKLAPANLPTLVRCYAPAPSPTPAPAGYTAWGEAFGDFGHSGTANSGSLDRSLGGVVAGVDTEVQGLPRGTGRVGAAVGYTSTFYRSPVDGGDGTVQAAFGSLYGGARFGAIDVRLGATVGETFNDNHRTVAFPGFNEVERSSNEGYVAQGFGEIGYRLPTSHFVLEPVAGAAIIHVHQGRFTEQGGLAALTGAAENNDVGTTTLGFRGEVAPFGTIPVVLHGFLGWQHAFGDVSPATVLAFEAAGSTPFTVTGAPIDRDALAAEASLDWRATEAFTLGLSYTGLVSRTADDNAVKGRAEYRF